MMILAKKCEPSAMIGQLGLQISRANEFLNLNDALKIKPNQVLDIAFMIIETFPVETMEDISIALRYGITGRYGKVYRFDIEVICGWIRSYLEEKAEAREKQIKTQKEEFKEQQVDDAAIAKILKESWVGEYQPKDPDAYRKFRAEYEAKRILNQKKDDQGQAEHKS